MIFYANPNSETARDLMSAGVLGCIDTPKQGNRVFPDDGWDVIADNGCFSDRWTERHWWNWLIDSSRSIRFAVCPDVFDPDGGECHEATVERWHRYSGRIERAGFTPAFVLQVGCNDYRDVPSDADVLFIGGTDTYKLGPFAASIARRAHRDGRWVHMGRVNSRRRFRTARAIECDSADGTILKHGPDENLQRVLSWFEDEERKPMLWEAK